MREVFSRQDILDGLSDLVSELQLTGETVGIRLVGGAAIALLYFERGLTRDVDSVHARPGADSSVQRAAALVAERRGWAPDWFNFEVSGIDALPTAGREVQWAVVFQSEMVSISVPSPDALLAMKLRSARPGRDTDDIRNLLSLCRFTSIAEVEIMYEAFYPGDTLIPRAVQILERLFSEGVPTNLSRVSPPVFKVDSAERNSEG